VSIPDYVYDGRQDQATRRARQARAQRQQLAAQPQPQSHAHQHHYERCYDYDPFRCRSTVTIALFAYVIVNDDSSRVASNTNRHPTLDICRLPEVRVGDCVICALLVEYHMQRFGYIGSLIVDVLSLRVCSGPQQTRFLLRLLLSRIF
jgi:hypothetical protein